MKSSFYNFFLEKGNRTICFNAFSFKFFDFDKKKEDLVKDIINNPDNYQKVLPLFYNKLKDGNFIVEENVFEPNLILQKYNEKIHSKHYKLVIMPTLQCNFRCWYCIQRHIKGKMNAETLERVFKHIKFMIIKEKIESLSLEWFGGEPFLYFVDVVKPISDFAKEICEKHNIPFYSSATTNGFLITSEIVDQMRGYNFKRFQITLDGSRINHNKTRVSKKASSFDTILNNINYMCSQLDCNISLRVNYDDKNLDPNKIIKEVSEIVSIEHRNKITFAFRRVWQVDFVKNERNKLKAASSLIRKEKYKVNADLTQSFIPCYTSRKFYNTISFNGDVHKCTVKDNLHEDSLGFLDKNGIIQWRIKKMEDIYYKPLFDNKECLGCRYLPVCMGPCTRRFEENGLKPPKFLCSKGLINGFEFEDSMLNYCKQILYNRVHIE